MKFKEDISAFENEFQIGGKIVDRKDKEKALSEFRKEKEEDARLKAQEVKEQLKETKPEQLKMF